MKLYFDEGNEVYGYFIFVPRYRDSDNETEINEAVTQLSMWGGFTKLWSIDGSVYNGYEVHKDNWSKVEKLTDDHDLLKLSADLSIKAI